VVVGDAAALDAPVVVHERPGGAVIAVEGQPDRTRGDELDRVRADAIEGDVEVAEDQPPVGDALEQLELVGPRLGPEGGEVGLGRGVPRARVVAQGGALGQGAELGDGRGVEHRATARHAAARGLAVRRLGRRPAIDVAPDPGGVLQVAQAGHRLGRPAAEDRVVAAEQIALRARGAGVVQHGLQRR
jgi:hypothetical protein